MSETAKINVAITGELSEPRSAYAERINSTSNGRYVPSLTLETHYLVASKFDSKKAKKAARYGTAIIEEPELQSYLLDGNFPTLALPEKPAHSNNFPEIFWDTVYEKPRKYLLTYKDGGGNGSVRTIICTGEGHTLDKPSTRWVGGYDGESFKTWRQDRIVELEEL